MSNTITKNIGETSYSVSFLLPIDDGQVIPDTPESGLQSVRVPENNTPNEFPAVATVAELTEHLKSQLGAGHVSCYRLEPMAPSELLDPAARYAVAADGSGITLSTLNRLQQEHTTSHASVAQLAAALTTSVTQLGIERVAHRELRNELSALQKATYTQLIDAEQRLATALTEERRLAEAAAAAEARARGAAVAAAELGTKLRALALTTLEHDYTPEERLEDPVAQLLVTAIGPSALDLARSITH